MSNTAWIVVGVIAVVLFVVLGIYLNQQVKNNEALIKQQRYNQLLSSVNVDKSKLGPLAFVNDILNTNSASAFFGVYGKTLTMGA